MDSLLRILALTRKELLAVLKDKSRKRDHIEAMRALAVMGDKAAKAKGALIEMVVSADNQTTLAAAIVATVHCAGKRPITVKGSVAKTGNGETSTSSASNGMYFKNIKDTLYT